MANKKKIATSVAAVAMAAAMLLGGTFAWQSISQTALNEASDIVNPGGRLHDDFNGENKDVYVENFADEPIYARVRLGEYMEIVVNKGMGEPIEKTVAVIGDKTKEDGVEKYNYITFTAYDGVGTSDGDNDGMFASAAVDTEGNPYWTWTTGGETVYMPTFNLNKDSLEADVNGTYEGPDGVRGENPENNNIDDKYEDYVDYSDPANATKTADEIYDADSNDVEDENVTKVEATHTATATDVAKLISMEEWMGKVVYDDNGEPANIDDLENYWVYDEDGWVYYSKPIQPHTATGLLLSGIKLNEVMDDSWYYAIQVTGQFITADDLGSMEDGTGFYDSDKGTPPSENAKKLLKAIGVEVPEDGTTGGEGGEVETYSISFGDKKAVIGSANTTGLDVSLLDSESASVTEGVTWTVSSDNAEVADGKVKASNSAAMSAVLEKYTLSASVGGEEVASTDLYMYDESQHVLDEYYSVTLDSGSTYCMFRSATSTFIQMDEQSGCVWRYGDDVTTIYQYTHTMNVDNTGLARIVEEVIYNKAVNNYDFDFIDCPHMSGYAGE